MESLFLELLNLSLSASILVLVVVSVRFLLKKAPKWLTCCLWILVAVRLVCPISIETAFSLIPAPISSGEAVTKVADTYLENHIVYDDTTDEYQTAVNAGRTPVYTGNGHYYVVTGADGISEPATIERTIIPVLATVWIAGICVMVLYSAISYLRLRHQVSASLLLRENIYLCDYIDTPFILGIVRPKIYLPSSMDQSQWHHVLAHEKAHLTRRDHWWKPLGFALLCLHWFNPVLWLAYILLCRDIELACDEKVIKELGELEKKAYSQALLECSVPRHLIVACPLAFGEVGVKERVKTVLDYKKPAFWITLLAIVAIIVTAVCFLTDPVTEPEKETAEFRATVLQSGGGAILVEPAEGAWELDSADQIWVSLPEGTPTVVVGDTVRIVYNGSIAASYPAQINSATLVEVLKDLEYLSENYSLNRAILDGCVTKVNGDVVAGQERWQEFMDAVSAGKPASVRLANYYTIPGPENYDPEDFLEAFNGYPVLTILDLSYDGNEYRIRFISNGKLYDSTYPYMLHYSGVEIAGYTDFAYRDFYVLSNQSELSWESYRMSIGMSATYIRTRSVYMDKEYADEPTLAELEAVKKSLEPYMIEYRIATLDVNELTGLLDVEVYEYVDGLFGLIRQYVDTDFVTVAPVKGTVSFTDWDLTVTGEGLDNAVCMLTFSPTGDQVLTYGERYTLEEYVDGGWQEVPEIPSDIDRVWSDAAYFLNQDAPTTITINWENLYGNLTAGIYRITKTIYGAGAARDYSVEFVIEDGAPLEISIEMQEVTAAAAVVEYQITNLGDYEVSAGFDYWLEIYTDAGWVHYGYPKDTLGWDAALSFRISNADPQEALQNQHDTIILQEDWSRVADSPLPAGRYRYCKRFTISSDEETRTKTVRTEFTIP